MCWHTSGIVALLMSYSMSLLSHFRLWIHVMLINAIPYYAGKIFHMLPWLDGLLIGWQFLHYVSTLLTFTYRYDMPPSRIALITLPVHLMR